MKIIQYYSILFNRVLRRYDLNRPLPAADGGRGPGGYGRPTQQILDFFRSNYAGTLTLLQKGARMPEQIRVKNFGLLAQLAADRQSTHTSQVNLVLKKQIQKAEALVASMPPKAAKFVESELAEFCSVEQAASKSSAASSSKVPLKDVRVTEDYLVNVVDERLSA